jgi:hypothetical protein
VLTTSGEVVASRRLRLSAVLQRASCFRDSSPETRRERKNTENGKAYSFGEVSGSAATLSSRRIMLKAL